MSSTLERHQEALTLCTYCPSLCRHMCPVSTEEARDSSSPWGLMSLADHVINGRLRLTSDVARAFYHCTGCGACTTFCLHDSDVAEVLVAARRFSVARGRAPFPRERFAHADADADSWWRSADRTILEVVRDAEPDSPGESFMAAMFERNGVDAADAEASTRAYVEHNDRIRSTFDSSRLIEWQPGDGWNPICAGLGLDPPVEPYPHANSSGAFADEMERVRGGEVPRNAVPPPDRSSAR